MTQYEQIRYNICNRCGKEVKSFNTTNVLFLTGLGTYVTQYTVCTVCAGKIYNFIDEGEAEE